MSTAWNPNNQNSAQPADPYGQPAPYGQPSASQPAAYGQASASQPVDPYGQPAPSYGQPSASQPGYQQTTQTTTETWAPTSQGDPAWGQPVQPYQGTPQQPGSPYALSPMSAAAGYGGAPVGPLQPVGFGRRFKGFLIDHGIALAIMLIGMIPFMIGYAAMISAAINADYTSSTSPDMSGALPWMMIGGVLMLIGSIVSWITTIWGRWIVGGKTGQSWGRKWAGTRLVDERTGQPIGIGMTIVRDLAHYVDGLAMDIGYLAPLFTEKKQTFADMIMHTIVVDEKDAPLRNQ